MSCGHLSIVVLQRDLDRLECQDSPTIFNKDKCLDSTLAMVQSLVSVQLWRLEAGVQHCRKGIRGFPWWLDFLDDESTMCLGAQKCFKYFIKHTASNQSKAVIIPWYSDWCSFTSGVCSLSQYRKDIKNIKMCPKEGNKHDNTCQLSKERRKGAHLILFLFSWHKKYLSHWRDHVVSNAWVGSILVIINNQKIFYFPHRL